MINDWEWDREIGNRIKSAMVNRPEVGNGTIFDKGNDRKWETIQYKKISFNGEKNPKNIGPIWYDKHSF